jgi:hypothetical protein
MRLPSGQAAKLPADVSGAPGGRRRRSETRAGYAASMNAARDRLDGRFDALAAAMAVLERLTKPSGTTAWIGGLERRLEGTQQLSVRSLLEREGIGADTLEAAMQIKRMSGQINVLVHAVGIVNALPYILEPGEVVETLSLGAGNTGRDHDLETDRRVAEFKFTVWRGADTIRQNNLFADLFNLANNPTKRAKYLYVVGKDIPLRFLENRRALSSVLKDARLAARFMALHGDRYETVRDFYDIVRDEVQIVDLVGIVPGLAPAASRLPNC